MKTNILPISALMILSSISLAYQEDTQSSDTDYNKICSEFAEDEGVPKDELKNVIKDCITEMSEGDTAPNENYYEQSE